MSYNFSFTNTDSEYSHKISDNVFLHLYRSTRSVAVIEFTDAMKKKIIIPSGFVVYTTDFQTNQKVIQKPLGNIYALCWTDDYIMLLHGDLLFHVRNRRTWDIINIYVIFT